MRKRYVDITELQVRDLGDVQGDRDDADARAAHARIEVAAEEAARLADHVVVIGGDNSLTRPAHARADAGAARRRGGC